MGFLGWDEEWNWETLTEGWQRIYDEWQVNKIIRQGLLNATPSVRLPDNFDEWRATLE